ncbi:MAG: RecQ family ATP-dependent DNA helicase [Spirochaetaceae bacterium]|jgi:ATP-dependent DNA helicase RecQ|nr:RecQ family ATP-dependent DNA helicase [Spirochaetaceae bacterium]
MENSDIPDPLTGAVKKLFGLSYLFPYQRLVVANILEAAEAAGLAVRWPEEVAPEGLEPPGAAAAGPEEADPADRGHSGRQIVILPTGAGKSLCFQLPAMLLPGPTLVIYPILSLMADQERSLRERGFAPVILRGGQDKEERRRIWEKLDSGESRFIIANPEVLLSPPVMERLGKLGILHVVIDEAHCVSEWGESFRPSYLEIGKIIQAAGGPPGAEMGGGLPMVTAFTATASAPVLEKIEQYIFGSGGARRIIGNPDRKNISYAAQGCILRDLAVRDLLMKNPRPAIVFCSSRRGTEKLARYLRNEAEEWASPAEAGSLGRRDIRFYHAGLSREEKRLTEGWFFKSKGGVLIATCAYGMGVDKGDIRTVIHRDCPPSVEAYLQESGRAGRDGLPSWAILLWGPDDEAALARIQSGADRQRLDALLRYGRNTLACRRRALLGLLNYEGEGDSPEEGCCDVCEGTALGSLREEASLTAFFGKNRRVYTLNEAVPVLTRGEPLTWSEDEARRAVNRLIRQGCLRRIKSILWKDKLSPRP